eukprot:09141_3
MASILTGETTEMTAEVNAVSQLITATTCRMAMETRYFGTVSTTLTFTSSNSPLNTIFCLDRRCTNGSSMTWPLLTARSPPGLLLPATARCTTARNTLTISASPRTCKLRWRICLSPIKLTCSFT